MSEKFREMIRNAVKNSGLSQNEIARRAGMSSAQISVYLNGGRDITTATAERILDALGLDPSTIKQK